MHDDLLNQIRNFIQNFQNGPPGEDKEHEATTDTELLSTEDIHPLAIHEPPRESDICQLIEECCVEAIHAVAPILSTREPENSLSMGYEHLSITPETESDEVTESNAENLLPIPNECEYVEASLSDPEIVSVEEEIVVHREEEEVDLE
nr:hypothetical protein [Tanacetum cinerariifolium]